MIARFGIVATSLGFLSTIIIAYACSLKIDYTVIQDKSDTIGEGWYIAKADGFGSTRVLSIPDYAWIADKFQELPGPYWSRTRGRLDIDSIVSGSLPEPLARIEDARGWPFRAFKCNWEDTTLTWKSPTLSNGVSLPLNRNASEVELQIQAIPTRPILPGLILDTFILGSPWFIFGVLVVKLRHRKRVLGGNCPRCGYNLQELKTCPECGWRLSK